MTHIFVLFSRVILVVLFAFYTYDCFAVLRTGLTEAQREPFYRHQLLYNYLFLLFANLILFVHSYDLQVVFLLGLEMVFFFAVHFIYRVIYPTASRSLSNNMCMLLSISSVILTRLSVDTAMRQLLFADISLLVTAAIPFLIRKVSFFNKLTYVYAVVGLLGLLIVAAVGKTVNGARLNLSFGPLTIQLSEFIKILFVFFVACMLYQSTGRRQILITSAVAAAHVLILVASKDLGSAGIFLLTYLVMLYVATKQPLYLLGGFVFGIISVSAANVLFSHVHNRFVAWRDPMGPIDGAGYQIAQSLFAIGTGGWFGSGLYQGMPEKIPVVTSDFIFSAISEELGAVFGLCLSFLCIGCFLMFFNIALQIRDPFYKLLALGLGTEYGTQVFLALGGVIRFIPSTGVTLPLVSYGGSSLLATMALFSIVQGLYVLREKTYKEA